MFFQVDLDAEGFHAFQPPFHDISNFIIELTSPYVEQFHFSLFDYPPEAHSSVRLFYGIQRFDSQKDLVSRPPAPTNVAGLV